MLNLYGGSAAICIPQLNVFTPLHTEAKQIIRMTFIGLMRIQAKTVTDVPSEYSIMVCNVQDCN